MPSLRALALLLLLGPALKADGLSDLRAALDRYPGRHALRAEVDRQSWSREKGKEPEVSRVQLHLSTAPEGPTVRSSTPEGSKAGRRKSQDTARQVLEAATVLRELLEGAKLDREVSELWRGQPARHLRLTAPVDQDEDAKKHLKEAWRVLDLWIAPDGTPLALLEEFKMRGRVFLFSFEAWGKIQREYRAVGDRLILLREETEARGSGAGHGGEARVVQTTALL